jgi:hypothetical protein
VFDEEPEEIERLWGQVHFFSVVKKPARVWVQGEGVEPIRHAAILGQTSHRLHRRSAVTGTMNCFLTPVDYLISIKSSGKRHQPIEAAPITATACEVARQPAAPEKLLKRLLHKAREALAVP